MKPSAVERARADLANGRPDLARDRLQGYLSWLNLRGEYDQDAYLFLGEVHFGMRDFARAGTAWLLTERDDADAQFAIAAALKRFGKTPANMLHAVNPRAPSELYPPKVRERLLEWNYRYRSRKRRATVDSTETESETEEHAQGLRPIEAGCIASLLFLIFLICVYVYMRFFGRH